MFNVIWFFQLSLLCMYDISDFPSPSAYSLFLSLQPLIKSEKVDTWESRQDMLATIKMPLNLMQLTDSLPGPDYESKKAKQSPTQRHSRTFAKTKYRSRFPARSLPPSHNMENRRAVLRKKLSQLKSLQSLPRKGNSRKTEKGSKHSVK